MVFSFHCPRVTPNPSFHMTEPSIRFDDGASYEHMMGRWSQLAGERFLDWVEAPHDARWLDVGCGGGAFTELLVQRCRPSQVLAFDPSPGQLAFARRRLPAGAPVLWAEGDAMHLPVADDSCDAAVMALVLFFLPDPAAGLARICSAVRSGGLVGAYHWDMLNGGFPMAPIGAEMRKLGIPASLPPSVALSSVEASAALWTQTGLRPVRTCQFDVEREFDDFEDYWSGALSSVTLRERYESLGAADRERLKANVARRLGAAPLRVRARANAVVGVKP